MKTTDKVRNFKKKLRNYCKPLRVLVISHFGSRWSENIVKLASQDDPKTTIRSLYIKDRGAEEGFWGLTEHQIDALQAQGKPWDVVLLVGFGEVGYLGTSQQVREQRLGWSFSKGDYKVHEDRIKGLFRRFETYDALFSLLFSTPTQN